MRLKWNMRLIIQLVGQICALSMYFQKHKGNLRRKSVLHIGGRVQCSISNQPARLQRLAGDVIYKTIMIAKNKYVDRGVKSPNKLLTLHVPKFSQRCCKLESATQNVKALTRPA